MLQIGKKIISANNFSVNNQCRYLRTVKQRFLIPILYMSYEERMKEKDKKLLDPERFKKRNIGFLNNMKNITKEEYDGLAKIKDDFDLQKKARHMQIDIDLDQVCEDTKFKMLPNFVHALAVNAAVFDHLFDEYTYFYPVVPMQILYDFDEESSSCVFAGNLLKPAETATQPSISFPSEPDQLWTLVMTNPDGNLYDNEREMLHWMVSNIRGGDVSTGDTLVPYLRPVPPQGSGYHRYVFLLFKQEKQLDLSQYRVEPPGLNLKARSFYTRDFYANFESEMTPAGLAWFNADFDEETQHFFHKTLQMKSPIFEYEFPKQYIREFGPFPDDEINIPFNKYLNLRRDPKETQKIMLLKRLKRVHPFEGEPKLLPYPLAQQTEEELKDPYYLQQERRAERLGFGFYRDVYRGDDRPYINIGQKLPRHDQAIKGPYSKTKLR